MKYDDVTVEALADYAHEAWAGWMLYFFSRCDKVQSGPWAGSLVIPNEWRERWQRQMNTPYVELSDAEKESDRDEARKMLATIHETLKSQALDSSPLRP